MTDDTSAPITADGIHRATLDALPDPVFAFDAGGSVQYWNAAASDATGYDEDALAAATRSDLFAGVTEEGVVNAARDGETVEALLATDGGERLPTKVRASRLSDGSLVVTARRLADSEHPNDEGRGILDRMTDAFFAVDEEFRLTYVNDHARELIVTAMDGDPDDDLTGLVLWDVVPEAVDTTFYDKYQSAMATQEPVSFEEYYEPLDAWLAARAYPSPSGLSVYFRDVTDRRRREHALAERERVLREMQDITADTDRSFTEQVNALLDLGTDVLGTSTGVLSCIRGDTYEIEAIRGNTDTQPGDTVALSATNCERTATERRTLVMANVARDAPELTGNDGYAEWGIACYLGAPVFVEDGVYGTFCFYGEEPRTEQFSEWEVTLVDLMSQWVGYELTRRRVRERLEAQNEKLERFASIVSHDLRNPLNVLVGYLDLAEESGKAEHFQRCRDTIARMETLVEDLLSLAQAGKGVDDVVPTDLAAVVEDAWTTVETGNATLVVDADVTIRADGSRLRQLLVNLFRNAVEHGSTGPTSQARRDTVERGSTAPRSHTHEDAVEHAGADVTVTVGALDGGFYVEDDGPGIPVDGRGDVFDVGYSMNDEGTGFGLNIVAEVAAAHGWTVSLTDADGGGARFEFVGVEAA
ncbi:PAS domain-containing protein [Halobacterium noricense]|uniref:PAS domain-containing protein n=1 Tax=Halobacterium noricense TaxID=223182 RepID=UPI001E3CCDEF|nr:PAS domain-containing protein [Halobacterium noricense]UHH24327.1 PAS domain-containing protein [Halobacterium noricense]